jgi:hypothetical protein
MVGNYTQSQDNRLMTNSLQALEINGGKVERGEIHRLLLSVVDKGYSDAQLDDYAGLRRKDYPWWPGAVLELRARFSHKADHIVGTAGFGFWNAPFGDPSIPWPALPRTAWFFYASEHSNLPLAREGPGRGWFASTIDSTRVDALVLAPFAPFLVVLNNVPRLRRNLWPFIRKRLRMSYQQLEFELDGWHDYRLIWKEDRCEFWLDGECVLETRFSPSGPMGFVCWIDNQFLIAKPTGMIKWGSIPVVSEQWLEISELKLDHL